MANLRLPRRRDSTQELRWIESRQGRKCELAFT